MPKRARQAHIPSQVRKRKPVRRSIGSSGVESAYDASEPVFADAPLNEASAAFGASGPVDTRPHRRLELLTRSRESTAVRVVPGQLPTFERSYLLTELRRIAMISGSLLAVIIALTFLLR